MSTNTEQPTPDFGEPWRMEAYNLPLGESGDFEGMIEIRTRDESRRAEACNPDDDDEDAFKRIVSCVNACRGMADPKAEIEMLKLARERAFDMADAHQDTADERDELRRDIAALLNALPNGAHDVTEGVGTIRAMREAIKEAETSLSAMVHWFSNMYRPGLAKELLRRIDACDAALVNLKPFTTTGE